MKKTIITILTLILTVTLGVHVADALGTLTVPANPGSATQYTLNDIYTKLTTGVSTSTKTGLFAIPGTVAASFHTLAEVYGAIPTIDATKVAVGTTYLGVTGSMQGAPAPLTWQTDPSLSLCFDATTDQINNGCSVGNGLVDPAGDGSVLLGAVEYCQNLESDGVTATTTPQNIWHLPTYHEFASITDTSVSGNATQVPGFAQSYGYWSSTGYAGNSSSAWYWNAGDGSIGSYYKYDQTQVRCVH
jgi:hypothetical protein